MADAFTVHLVRRNKKIFKFFSEHEGTPYDCVYRAAFLLLVTLSCCIRRHIMAECRIGLSANAGVAININGSKLMIDAFHQARMKNYSPVTDEQFDIISNCSDFNNPEILLYTHMHADHFSRELTDRALKLWKDAVVIAPEKHWDNQITPVHSFEKHIVKGWNIECIRLTHEGAEYKNVVNFAYMVEKDGIRILHAGDTELASRELGWYLLRTDRIDIALLDYPWITTSKGRNFIENIMMPGAVAAIHLPCIEDDERGYNKNVRTQAEKLDCADIRIFNKRFQTEVFTI